MPWWRFIPLLFAVASLGAAATLAAIAIFSGERISSPGGGSAWAGFNPVLAVQASALLVWPAVSIVAAVRRWWMVSFASASLFTAHAAIFGLSVGGLHFSFSIPLAWLSFLALLLTRRRGDPFLH